MLLGEPIALYLRPVPGLVEGGGGWSADAELRAVFYLKCFVFFPFCAVFALLLGAEAVSFACSSPVGGTLFGVSGLLLL